MIRCAGAPPKEQSLVRDENGNYRVCLKIVEPSSGGSGLQIVYRKVTSPEDFTIEPILEVDNILDALLAIYMIYAVRNVKLPRELLPFYGLFARMAFGIAPSSEQFGKWRDLVKVYHSLLVDLGAAGLDVRRWTPDSDAVPNADSSSSDTSDVSSGQSSVQSVVPSDSSLVDSLL